MTGANSPPSTLARTSRSPGVFAHGVDDLHAFVLAGLADGIEAERVDHGFGDGVLNIEKLNGRLLFRRERLAGGNEAECVAAVFAAVDGKKNAHEGYLLFEGHWPESILAQDVRPKGG